MVALINEGIIKFAAVITAVLGLLPQSPFKWVLDQQEGWVAAIAWAFPVAQIVAHLETYVTAVAVYYAIRIVLRWLKVASS